MTREPRRSNSFVFRLWWEEGGALPLWRGWIQHAASGETCYFCYLTELLAFIEVYTGSLAQAPGAEAPRTRRGGDDD